MNKWAKYVKENSRHDKYYADCQLVTTINAYFHLTGKIIDQNSRQYKRLAEIAGCCYGSCVNITKVWDKLGIEEKDRFRHHDLNQYLKANCGRRFS